MIVAFSGWRAWTDETFVRRQLDEIYADGLFVRVGDAAGVDQIVRDEVTRSGIWVLTVYEARWDTEGRGAGAIRNRRMLLGLDSADPNRGRPADLLIAFPEPGRATPARNSGTWNCIHQAHWRGIEVRVPGYQPSTVASPSGSLADLWGGR
jgi:hypothetical protein